MGRRYKFPSPNDVKASQRAVLCPADRVIALYNQDSGHPKRAVRFSKKVRDWFFNEAQRHGWAGAHFLKDVQSNHGSGCVLWISPREVNVSVTVTKETLVLVNSAED